MSEQEFEEYIENKKLTFLEILISEDKDNYHGRVHCNDEPKQNPSLSTQPLYLIAGLSEEL